MHHRLIQMQCDADLFNRWESGQALARDILINLSRHIESGTTPKSHKAIQSYTKAIVAITKDENIDMGFKALAMSQPLDSSIVQACYAKNASGIDPLAVYQAGKMLRRAIAKTGEIGIERLYIKLSKPTTFTPDAEGAGRRALRNICLSYLSQLPFSSAQHFAQTQLRLATNMTEELAGLMTLVKIGGEPASTALETFYQKWQHNPLVVDKWFAVSAQLGGHNALDKIKQLTNHPDYINANPNRVRSLIGSFATANLEIFHASNGSGYRFFADNVLAIDKRNPQLAARLLGVFSIWNKLDSARQNLMRAELTRILHSKPSTNVLEIATKSLGD